MQLGQNKFKHGLIAGKRQIGLWSSLCSPLCAEIIAHSGYDWVVLDMEHSPNELPGVMAQLQAMAASNTNIVVRPPWNDKIMIKRILDIGARNILLPYVQNVEEAKQAVRAVRYPKAGIRGVAGITRATRYGRIENYFHNADSEICVLLQLETIEALEQLEEIVAIDGVDGIFIGPSDLSASMGYIGNNDHEEVKGVIKHAAQTLTKAGMASGILAIHNDTAQMYIDWGFQFVAVGIDAGLLVKAADELCAKFKDQT